MQNTLTATLSSLIYLKYSNTVNNDDLTVDCFI